MSLTTERINARTDLRPSYGGTITVTGGSGGRGRDRPVIRALLDRVWAEWDDFEMVEAGYSRDGDRRYRRQYTPLGRAIRALRKEHPDHRDVWDLLEGVPEPVEKKYAPLVEHLAKHDLRFGMTRWEMDAVVKEEEDADALQEAADVERARCAEILRAVLHVMNQPWLPSEKRLGRLLLGEDHYEGLQEELVMRGFTVTAVGDDVRVRPR